MLPNRSVNVPQDMLHLLYLTAAEYTRAGLPDFWLSNSERGVDFQWTDLLAYLPNPTNQPLPDRFTGYTVLHLLPSCGGAQDSDSPTSMQRANEKWCVLVVLHLKPFAAMLSVCYSSASP